VTKSPRVVTKDPESDAAEEMPQKVLPATGPKERISNSGGHRGSVKLSTGLVSDQLISECTVIRWLKREGEYVEVDEPLVELETDKVSFELPSPASGILREIFIKDGETFRVTAELAVIQEG
jgi:biotin carboxyl carrier protein